jgi:hypothetical protein
MIRPPRTSELTTAPRWCRASRDLRGNKAASRLPLAPEAEAIIMRQPRLGPYVFTVYGNRPISSASCDHIKRDLNKLIAGDGQAAMERWVLHDLRRSPVTGLHEYELADPHTIELIVNHVGGVRGGIAGVYDRSARMDARRRALEAWAKLMVSPNGAD